MRFYYGVIILIILLSTMVFAYAPSKPGEYKPAYTERNCCEKYYAGEAAYFNDVSKVTAGFFLGTRGAMKTIDVNSPAECCNYVSNRDACYSCINAGYVQVARQQNFDDYFWLISTIVGIVVSLLILMVVKTQRSYLFKSGWVGGLIGGFSSLIFWIGLSYVGILINQLYLYFFRHFTLFHWTLFFVYGFLVGAITGMTIKLITKSSNTSSTKGLQIGFVIGVLSNFLIMSMNTMTQYYGSYRLTGQLGVDLGYYFRMPPAGWSLIIVVIVLSTFIGWIIGKIRSK